MTKIAVIGTGYVGLTTGACFAHLGHEVICADIDENKIKILSSGRAPFVEDGLDRLVEEAMFERTAFAACSRISTSNSYARELHDNWWNKSIFQGRLYQPVHRNIGLYQASLPLHINVQNIRESACVHQILLKVRSSAIRRAVENAELLAARMVIATITRFMAKIWLP